jgi:hypothetical protein|tara:strand:+ start:969 stop:1337 length:369 start_codon:yes stop_codon:yes gene_type:complete
MANDFKRFTVTNVNTSTGASASAVYTVPAGAGSSALESIIIGITLANTTTAGITASVFLDNNSGSNDVHIVKNATIPAGSSLEVMAGNKLVVQNSGSAGDVIRVSAGTASACDATISVLEDV